MKKFLYIILTALAVIPFVACQQEEEVYKPEVKDITVVSVKNLVFLPAGGSGSINVDCATSFTATSDKSWCTVAVNGKEVTVTASANPTNESRYASILMKTSQSSQTVVVQQVGEILSGLALADLEIPQKGKSLAYGYMSNLSVSMSSDQDWVHFEMVDDEDEGTMVYVTIDENPAFRIRRATVTYQAGSQSKSAVFTQLPKFGAVSGWTVDDTGGRFVFPDQIDEITVTPPSSMADVHYFFSIGSVDDYPSKDVDAEVEKNLLELSAALREGLADGSIKSMDDLALKGPHVEEFSNLPASSMGFIACFDAEGYPTGQYALVPVSIPDRGPVKQRVDGWDVVHAESAWAYPDQTDVFSITPKSGYEDVRYIATVVGKDQVSDIDDYAFTTFAMTTRESILAKVASGELSSFEAGLNTGATTLSVMNTPGDVYVIVVAFGDNQFYTGDYQIAEFAVSDLKPAMYDWVGQWSVSRKNSNYDSVDTWEISVKETDKTLRIVGLESFTNLERYDVEATADEEGHLIVRTQYTGSYEDSSRGHVDVLLSGQYDDTKAGKTYYTSSLNVVLFRGTLSEDGKTADLEPGLINGYYFKNIQFYGRYKNSSGGTSAVTWNAGPTQIPQTITRVVE